jgi:hypothetical protein
MAEVDWYFSALRIVYGSSSRFTATANVPCVRSLEPQGDMFVMHCLSRNSAD